MDSSENVYSLYESGEKSFIFLFESSEGLNTLELNFTSPFFFVTTYLVATYYIIMQKMLKLVKEYLEA
jgi:hypothetical protein